MAQKIMNKQKNDCRNFCKTQQGISTENMRRFLLTTAAFVIGTICFAGNGNETGSTEKDSIKRAYNLDEVVVEAFKQNTQINLRPVSASLLNASDIRTRGIINMKELSALAPNLFIPDYGTKFSTPVYIRGIGSRTGAPSVGLYVDGVPYFDRSSFDFNFNDISRIEILRGSQGTIYGRNTMGGIINIYTQSPFLHQGGFASVAAGNYNSYNSEASYYGLLGNNFGYGISLGYIDNGGFFTNQYTGNKADKLRAPSGRFKLSWRFAPQWVAHLTSSYEYLDQNGFPYAPYDTTTHRVADVNYNRDSYYRRNMTNNGLRFQYVGDAIKFSSQSSFQYFDGNQGVDQDFTTTDTYYVYFTQRQQMYSQEFNLQSAKPNRYQWLFGAFAFDQHARQSSDTNILPKATHSTNDIKNPSTGFALYHQSSFKNIGIEGVTAIVGVRYDWEQIKLTSITGNGTTNNTPINAQSHYTQFTPKFSLQYESKTGGISYATITKGYKAGGFNTAVDTEDERAFKPEHSWTYELGIKKDLLNNLLHVEASLFYIDWRDQQIARVRLSGQGNKTLNAGKSKSKGVEASAQLNLLKNLNLFANYGYTYAQFKDYVYNKNAGIDYSGNMLPLVPRHTLSVGGDYRINPVSEYIDQIDIHLEYVGLGKLYWTESNVGTQPFYGVINTNIRISKGNFSLDLWTKNLADEHYAAYQFTFGKTVFGQAGKPFTCGAKLNVRF